MSTKESNDTAEKMDTVNGIEDSNVIPTVVPPIPIDGAKTKAIAGTLEEYKEKHKFSITNPNKFWFEQATKHISWFNFPFDESSKVCHGTFMKGDVSWFATAKLNICYNAVDRHVNAGNGDKVAMIWEGDEVNEIRHITFLEMQNKISQICHTLSNHGVTKGDVVTIYMPMSKYTIQNTIFFTHHSPTVARVISSSSPTCLAFQI
jgi:hypothetical protein